MAQSRDAQGSGTKPAAATAEVFMLMPLVKPSVLRAAGLDREAAASLRVLLPLSLARVLRDVQQRELEEEEGMLV